MTEKHQKPPQKPQQPPPAIGPFFFPALLFFLGLWCVYDGWINMDPEMLRHQMFNRIMGGVFLPWSVIDFVRTWKSEQLRKAKNAIDKIASKDDSES